MRTRRFYCIVCVFLILALLGGCAARSTSTDGPDRATKRDKTKKGAAIGAASGAVLGALIGEGELDEVLASAAIGAGIGAGVGAYMDKQEERFGRIPGTTVERVSDDMLLVHFESDILFEVNSAELQAASRAALEQAVGVFNEFPKTAIIAQGHTDSTGGEAHNQELSERRAKSVMNDLIARGVDAGRLLAAGYGESHPVASNDSSDGRRLNRRVDLLLKAKAR
ncbi:MAG: OmpA family protein [bacterium]|nr:OmpA family protein [bacterium]